MKSNLILCAKTGLTALGIVSVASRSSRRNLARLAHHQGRDHRADCGGAGLPNLSRSPGSGSAVLERASRTLLVAYVLVTGEWSAMT